MSDVNQRQIGIYNKFTVKRNDGRDEPGRDRHGAEYFVLDMTHDEYAKPALMTYAIACQGEYPRLSSDLIKSLLGGEAKIIQEEMDRLRDENDTLRADIQQLLHERGDR
jgi:hypothetical protein